MKFQNGLSVWKTAFQNTRFKIVFVTTGVVLWITAFYFSRFLNYVEARPGVTLTDPVLDLFLPYDLTWAIFSIIYLSVILALFHLLCKPAQLLLGIQAYIFLLVIRTISMYLVPLEAPALLIPLEDPFVQSISSGVLTKDLFFSGHTSTLFLLYLVIQHRTLKILFLSATLSVAIFVLWQHVHYTIDVLAAPFYAYTCYGLSIRFNQWLFNDISDE